MDINGSGPAQYTWMYVILTRSVSQKASNPNLGVLHEAWQLFVSIVITHVYRKTCPSAVTSSNSSYEGGVWPAVSFCPNRYHVPDN